MAPSDEHNNYPLSRSDCPQSACLAGSNFYVHDVNQQLTLIKKPLGPLFDFPVGKRVANVAHMDHPFQLQYLAIFSLRSWCSFSMRALASRTFVVVSGRW